MTYKYFPHTDDDLQQMMQCVGVKSLDALYADVPESIRFKGDYNIPKAHSELELRQLFEMLANDEKPMTCFAGAGIYDHYAPAVVQNIVERSEYLTSYTPYQAEVSQGTLHYIFEYQSMMAALTGMDISNASMYDGATATAEAVMMAAAAAKKARTVLLSSTLDPKVVQVVETYAKFHGIDIEMVPQCEGVTDREALNNRLQQGGVAGVVVQAPNYFGIVEDFTGMADAIHQQKGLFIINSIAADLAILKTPGEWGADIAVGEAQSLGIPMSYGGPGLGYMCVTEKMMRKMPGRLVGMTKDSKGQRAFVLTLQAREQHIRRQKATSNICSNQSLMALYVTIYLALMGQHGLRQAAEASYGGAHYLADELQSRLHCHLTYQQPFFNECCITFDRLKADDILDRCAASHYLAGTKINEHTIMMAVTEQRTTEEIDALVRMIQEMEDKA